MTRSASSRRLFLSSAATGASLLLGAAMLLAKLLAAAPLPVEMLFNITGRLLGVPWVFNLVHRLPWSLDGYAKYALFVVTIVVFLAAFGILGVTFGATARRLGRWPAACLYALSLPFLVGLVLLPLQGLGLLGLGRNFQYPPVPSHLWALAFGAVYGVALAMLSRGRTVDPARRATLEWVGKAGLVVLGAGLFGRLLAGAAAWAQIASEALTSFLAQLRGLSPEITSTKDHYVVSKNIFNPSVTERGWKLALMGMVDQPLALGLDDLKALPSVERSSTLTCISNRIGGDLIGNSVWTGVRLRDLLEMAGVGPGANEVILWGADNYSDSFPLAEALRDGAIVAYLQNGEPLTRDHGFPARVLVPGIYGMKNVKWVQQIELADRDYQGYWQTRGWSDVAIVQTMSRIDTRQATRLDDATVGIGGIAYAGLRGIQRVEVSVDGGTTWQEAVVKPAVNELSWNLWGFHWEAEPGTYTVLVRATDGTGTVQTATRTEPLPDGATGYHIVQVVIS